MKGARRQTLRGDRWIHVRKVGLFRIPQRRINNAVPFLPDDLIGENLTSEPQSKRRALERSVEFVEDDIPPPSFRSTPVARSSLRPLRGSSLAFNLSHANISRSQDPLAKNSSLFSLGSKLKIPEVVHPSFYKLLVILLL